MPGDRAPWELPAHSSQRSASKPVSVDRAESSAGQKRLVLALVGIVLALVVLAAAGAALKGSVSNDAASPDPAMRTGEGLSPHSQATPPQVGGSSRKGPQGGPTPRTEAERAAQEAQGKATNLAKRIRDEVKRGREPRYLYGGPNVRGCGVTMQEMAGKYYRWADDIYSGTHGKKYRLAAVRVNLDTSIPPVVYAEFDLDDQPPVLYYK